MCDQTSFCASSWRAPSGLCNAESSLQIVDEKKESMIQLPLFRSFKESNKREALELILSSVTLKSLQLSEVAKEVENWKQFGEDMKEIVKT